MLFDDTPFTGASGKYLNWKFECEALTDEDWLWAAHRAVELCPEFCSVHGVPTGGEKFAAAVREIAEPTPGGMVLIVDDVITTGGSIKAIKKKLVRNGKACVAVGLFDRRKGIQHAYDRWIHGILTVHPILAYRSLQTFVNR